MMLIMLGTIIGGCRGNQEQQGKSGHEAPASMEPSPPLTGKAIQDDSQVPESAPSSTQPSLSLADKGVDRVLPPTEDSLRDEIRPVYNLLKAVSTQDTELIKTVWCTELSLRMEKNGWDTVLSRYRESMCARYGKWSLEDFAFEFTGGSDQGQVVVIHRGKDPQKDGSNSAAGLSVIREDTAWKIEK